MKKSFAEATPPRAGAHVRAFFPGSTFNPPRDKLNVPARKSGLPARKLDLPADKSNVPADNLDLHAGKLNVHAGKLDLSGGRESLPKVRARKRGPPFSMAGVRRNFAGARYVSPGGPLVMEASSEVAIARGRSGSQTRRMTTANIVRALVVTSLLAALGGARLHAAPPPQAPAPCAASEFHQFDFWIGDWDTFEIDDAKKVVARNRVDLILDGCVLREVYEGDNGLVGQSFTIYDASRKVWHQTWVTNRGQLLTLEGGREGDRILLKGTNLGGDGKPVSVRAIWIPEKDGVQETAEASSDGGKTWKPMFDIVFRVHRQDP